MIRSLTWSGSPPSPPPPLCSMTFVTHQLRKCMLGRVESGAYAPYHSHRASSPRRIEPSAQWRACSSRCRPGGISMHHTAHAQRRGKRGLRQRDGATGRSYEPHAFTARRLVRAGGIDMNSGSAPTHRLPLIIHLCDLIVDPLRSITPARLETRSWTINRRHPARPLSLSSQIAHRGSR